MPDLLADLGLPEAEVYAAVADLHELGLIAGTGKAWDRRYAVRIDGLTARGWQELP
jgi:DNA-binding IclR family transcriptional regulator